MEKIQAAIAKARAARDAQMPEPGTAPGPAPGTVTPLAAPTGAAGASAMAVQPDRVADRAADRASGLAAAWIGLREFQPDARHMQRNRILSFAGGRDAVGFDVMRTKLLQQIRANNWRRVGITSPNAACGKTMTTLNLAFSLARQPDVRTLVAEIDLRRPAMAKTLGLKASHNFAKVLEGTAAFEDNVVRYGTNLAFATNAVAARNPAELLQNPQIGAVLADIEARYDPTVILFDMPPMLVSDDAIGFASQVDCVLLIAAAESTTVPDVDVCERDLAAQTNVLGVVLNKCRYLDRSYGYSYYG